jgi:hypothetical protein
MSSLSRSFRRALSLLAATCLLAFFAVRPALAANYDYTDAWYVPAESGWGVIFTQSNNFIFATFFIYGQDKKPTWYTAHMTWDGLTKFTGPLYLHQGSYYADPWNPADHPNDPPPAGTATFTPSTTNNYQGTLTYTVTGVGTVTKAIERLPLTPMLLAGNYVGGQAGAYSGCTSNSSNNLYQDFYTLQVTQAGNGVSMKFSFTGGSLLVCTLAGTFVQTGQLGGIPSASYQCSDGLKTNASVYNLRATPLGIEGQFSAPNVSSGCREDANFSATHN